jgi:tRNA (guanine10-N2)-methyltransferase
MLYYKIWILNILLELVKKILRDEIFQMHCLFWCAADHQEFRIPEFESLSRLFNIPLRWVFQSSTYPWIILDLASVAEARLFLSRSLSCKYCVLLWGEGAGYPAFHDNLKTYPFQSDSAAAYLASNESYKIDLESFGKTVSLKERVDRFEALDYVPFQAGLRIRIDCIHLSSRSCFRINFLKI